MTDEATHALMRQFNDAFQRHEPALLTDLVAADCVIENTDDVRHVGRDACLALWRAIATAPIRFDLEDVIVTGDRAIIFWRLHRSDTPGDSVRGVNLMRVRDGQIVEARGYLKAG